MERLMPRMSGNHSAADTAADEEHYQETLENVRLTRGYIRRRRHIGGRCRVRLRRAAAGALWALRPTSPLPRGDPLLQLCETLVVRDDSLLTCHGLLFAGQPRKRLLQAWQLGLIALQALPIGRRRDLPAL